MYVFHYPFNVRLERGRLIAQIQRIAREKLFSQKKR